MSHSLRRHDTVAYAADITVHLRDGDDYIIRQHEFTHDVQYRDIPRDAGGLLALMKMWRRRHVTRRHLSLLDARGLADIGLDADAAIARSPSHFGRFERGVGQRLPLN